MRSTEMTASKAPLVRIQLLTAARSASPAAVGYLAEPDVVDSFKEDDVTCPGLPRVAQEPGLRVPAEAGRVAEDAVAADAFVHDSVLLGRVQGNEPPRQVIGPSQAGVDGGLVAIGDGIPERDHSAPTWVTGCTSTPSRKYQAKVEELR
jgi:hypothetical protein